MNDFGDHRGRESMTAGDIGFLDGLMARTAAIYAAKGGHYPIGYVERSDGKMAVIESNDIGSEAERTMFTNVLRYHSLRTASRRSAVVAEGWAILDHDEDTMREVAAYVERGGRVSQHPLAREIVTIIVESDAGITLQTMAIDRKAPGMAILTPEGDARFLSWDEGAGNTGVVSGFHVRSAMRIRADVIAWGMEMDRHLASMVREAVVEDVPRPVSH